MVWLDLVSHARRPWTTFLMVWVFLGILVEVTLYLTGKIAWGINAYNVLVGMLVLALPAWLLSRREARRNESPFLRELSKGEVEEIRVVASRVLKVEAAEDGHPAYIFDLGAGRSLMIQDPATDTLAREGFFPSTMFSAVLAPESRRIVTISAEGKPLAPFHTSPPFGKEDYILGRAPANGLPVDKPVESWIRGES